MLMHIIIKDMQICNQKQQNKANLEGKCMHSQQHIDNLL